MQEIKFNWVYAKFDPMSRTNRWHRPATQMINKGISEMDALVQDSDFKNRIQMANINERLCKEIENPYQYWNGCVWVDIDYKDYPNATEDEWNDISLFVIDRIKTMYQDNLYYYETSRSHKGGHFIFYFDTERTEDNFKRYSHAARQIVYNAFADMGYKDIIDYSGVFDTCCKSIYQCVYITKYDCTFFDKCNGKVDSIDIKYEEKKSQQYKNEDTTFKFRCLKWKQPKSVDYIEHKLRWRLFESLSRLFKDDELKSEWEKCARMIPERNGHTTQYYIDCPYSICDWNYNLKGDEYCDIDLLHKFGYEVQTTQYHKEKKVNYDDIIDLINIFNNMNGN